MDLYYGPSTGNLPQGTITIFRNGVVVATISLLPDRGAGQIAASFSVSEGDLVTYRSVYAGPSGPVTTEYSIPWYQSEYGLWSVAVPTTTTTAGGSAQSVIYMYLFPHVGGLSVAPLVVGESASAAVGIQPIDSNGDSRFLPPATRLTLALADPGNSFVLENVETGASGSTVSATMGAVADGNVRVALRGGMVSGSATLTASLTFRGYIAGSGPVRYERYGGITGCGVPCFTPPRASPLDPSITVYGRGHVEIIPSVLEHATGALEPSSIEVTAYRGGEEGGGIRWSETVPIRPEDVRGHVEEYAFTVRDCTRSGTLRSNQVEPELDRCETPQPRIQLPVAEAGDRVEFRVTDARGRRLPNGGLHVHSAGLAYIYPPVQAPLATGIDYYWQCGIFYLSYSGGPDLLSCPAFADTSPFRYNSWVARVGGTLAPAPGFFTTTIPAVAAGDTVAVQITALDPDWTGTISVSARHVGALFEADHYEGAPFLGRPAGRFERLDTGERGAVFLNSMSLSAPLDAFQRGDVVFIADPPGTVSSAPQPFPFPGAPIPEGTYTVTFTTTAHRLRPGAPHLFTWVADDATAAVGVAGPSCGLARGGTGECPVQTVGLLRQNGDEVTEGYVMVSRVRPDWLLDFPDLPFEPTPRTVLFPETGPPLSTQFDPHTYRPEAAGLPLGIDESTVQFRLTVLRQGMEAEIWDEGVEGGAHDLLTEYPAVCEVQGVNRQDCRSLRYVRLVSNARPASLSALVRNCSAPQSGTCYDDEHLGTRTIRVELGDVVRWELMVEGVPQATREYTVGASEAGAPGAPSPDPHDIAQTVRVRFVGTQNLEYAVDPAGTARQMSQMWAQAGLNVQSVNPWVASTDVVQPRAPIEIDVARDDQLGRPALFPAAGTIEARINGGAWSSLSVNAGEPVHEAFVQLVGLLGPASGVHVHQYAFRRNPTARRNYSTFVYVDRVEVTLELRLRVQRLRARSREVRSALMAQAEPSSQTGAQGAYQVLVLEAHALALMRRDADDATVNVYVLPDAAFNLASTGLRGFAYGIRPVGATALNNSVFLRASAADGSDQHVAASGGQPNGYPHTAGHEVGHVLFNVSFPLSDSGGHVVGLRDNIMTDGSALVANQLALGSRRRLMRGQQEDARTSQPSLLSPFVPDALRAPVSGEGLTAQRPGPPAVIIISPQPE